MKRFIQGVTAVAVSLMMVGSVSAHVAISPKEAVIGYSTLSVSVPTEKDIPTVEVRLVVPEGVDVHGVAAVSGWTHTETMEQMKSTEPAPTSDDGDPVHMERISEVTWTGGKIGAGEFAQFPISISYAGEPKELVWKAYQKYSDGTVVAWDGTDEKKPAPKVAMVTTSKLDQAVTDVAAVKKSSGMQAPWLSIGAFLLSVVALAKSVKRNE